MVEFNRLQQRTDVEGYFNKFEDLRFYLLLINPIFNEAYFVYCFIGGLKPDLESMVRVSNPQTMIDALEVAKLHEKTLTVIYKNIQPPKISITQPKITFPPIPKAIIGLSPKNLPLIVTRNPATSQNNPSLETLREKKLCCKCHDKYFPGHQCKVKALNSIEGTEATTIFEEGESSGVMEEQKFEVNDEEAVVNAMEECEEEAWINMLDGPDRGPNTIKIPGILQNEPIIVLVDSEATHSFLDPQLAEKLKLVMDLMVRPMKVRVANGGIMWSKISCPNVIWQMQGEVFKFDL